MREHAVLAEDNLVSITHIWKLVMACPPAPGNMMSSLAYSRTCTHVHICRDIPFIENKVKAYGRIFQNYKKIVF